MSVKQYPRTSVACQGSPPRRSAARLGAHALIRAYQLTLSGLIGRQCRHLPSCSEYADEAIARHGVWAGCWMGVARICRCGPGGTSGLDFVCEELPREARWYAPWRYGRWRGVNPGTP
jgi:putative membrane protein insertion efficiency factor